MATLFQHPGGLPRYHTQKDPTGHIVIETGTGRAVWHISDNTVYDGAGKPVFHIEDDWLIPHDGSPATLYFGHPVDAEPNPGAA